MRICLICTEKLPVPSVRGGAIQIYIENILPWLSRSHRFTVVSCTDPLLPVREVRESIRFVRLPSRSPEHYVRGVAQFLWGEPPFDLLVVYNRPAFVPVLAPAARTARLMLSMHNEMLAPNRISHQEARRILAMVDGVITISDFIRNGIDRLYPGYGHKLQTVRSGVDLSRFLPWFADDRARKWRRVLRRELGLTGRTVIAHVSRFSEKKGNHLALAAMEQVLEEHPSANMLLVGSTRYGSNRLDPYGQAIQERALALPDGAVCMTGFLPPVRIADLLLAADLFLCASQWEEPLARVHYEAMAAGLPIITTDRGGNAEVMEEGGNGLIARPYDDPGAFAAHILTLARDPALRLAMGVHGRVLAEELYPWERVAAELLGLFVRR
jgi:spore coat protein SA